MQVYGIEDLTLKAKTNERDKLKQAGTLRVCCNKFVSPNPLNNDDSKSSVPTHPARHWTLSD